jgi:hypothetical protein
MLYEFSVSRSDHGAWRVMRGGLGIASFRTFEEALAAARAWESAESTA